MIAKCVALLAVVAQINCYAVNSNCGSSASSAAVGSSGAVTRNIVASGKYPVALDNNGPAPDPRVPVSTTHVQAPVQEKPTIRLPAKIPAPRVVSHSCTCYKTILRPRVYDQYITVPTVQRYIETTHKPVVENIHYEAVPVNSDVSSTSSGVVLTGDLSSSRSVPVLSGELSSARSVPVLAAAVDSVPVSAAVEAVPVSYGYGVSPVASSFQVGSSFPVRAISTGCGSQGFY